MAEENTKSKPEEGKSDGCKQDCTPSTDNTKRPHDKRKMTRCSLILIFCGGIVLLTIGFLISGFWWHVFDSIVREKLPLSNGSDSQTFDMWTKNDFPFHFKVYMFNWTNAEMTVVNGDKPNLHQVGPYVYRMEVYRKNFVWNPNDTLTYLTGQRFYFVPELSNGNPYTDVITSPNVILLAIADRLSRFPTFVKIAINQILKSKGIHPYVTQSVSSLLFDGYDDKLLDYLKPFKKFIPDLKALPDQFAWYRPKNISMADILNIYTGKEDLSKMGLLYARNYSTRLPAFEGLCSEARGSPGDFWPTNIAKQENISLFISDFCSSFELKKQNEEVVNGINGIRFEGGESTFDDGARCPEKRCYCPDGICSWKSGIRDLSSCVQAPVFASFPHFYAADPSYIEKVRGLNPDKKLHSFHMTFQKDYGLLLKGTARFQLNLRLESLKNFRLFESVPITLIPALWFEEDINLPSSVMDKLHFSFTTVPLILSIFGLTLVILGSLIILSGVILLRLNDQSVPYVNERLAE